MVSTRPVIVMSRPMYAVGFAGRAMPATNSALDVVAPSARVGFWTQMPESALKTFSKFEP